MAGVDYARGMTTLSGMDTGIMSPDAAHTARARLVEHLERLSPRETACEAMLLAELAPAVPDRDALRALLRSIGAVCFIGGWCLSDGAPLGWTWRASCADNLALSFVLVRDGAPHDNDQRIAEVVPGRSWQVQSPRGALVEALSSGAIGLADGQRASLRVCRLHGLFA